MTPELVLVVWTAVGVGWWAVALVLVLTARHAGAAAAPPDPRRLTVFKPLPSPLDEREAAALAECLETFVAELDADSELLIGSHERDAARWRRLVDALRERYPGAEIRLVTHAAPYALANPKVSWMKLLAPHATGELWLWSDSDMRAPRALLRSLRADMALARGGLVTSPYLVRDAGGAVDLLDALAVNMEFYPGVVLLARLRLLRFAFGAGMLFEAAEFRRRVDWEFLGSCLAEDYHLGRLLRPVRLAAVRLETLPLSTSWRSSVLHYLRWKKTIRWCSPLAFAGQLAVLPVLGWLAWALLHPRELFGWAGLAGVLAADTAAVIGICGALGCRLAPARLAVAPLWSLLRGLSWVACWLPWPILWRGQRWWSPFRRRGARGGPVEAPEPPPPPRPAGVVAEGEAGAAGSLSTSSGQGADRLARSAEGRQQLRSGWLE